MQQVWRKRWRNSGWIALAATTLVLLVFAITKKNQKVCSGIEVSFDKEGNNFFFDEKGIVSILKEFGSIKGEPIKSINLEALEARLKSYTWIANAELFFDNKQGLQVIVDEKEPVARVFTVEGSSFYIDSACMRLPLSEKLSARIPMFTSFPSERTHLSRPDSQLLASVKKLAMFIQADEFWKAQVAQVDITPEGFEMIPTVGNHIVALGKGGDWQQKFDRLYSFYKQVWTKVGFEKYDKVDVQFDGQVVATVKGSRTTRVDTAKVRMAFENLVADVKRTTDSVATQSARIAVRKDTAKAKAPVLRASLKTNVAGVKRKLPAQQHVVQGTSRMIAPGGQAGKQVIKQSLIKQVAVNKRRDVTKAPKAVMKATSVQKGESKRG